MASSRSSPTVNWERLVRAALKRDRAAGAGPGLGLDSSVQYWVPRATIVNQILQAVDDIDDLNVARILCDQAYTIAQNLDSSSSDGLGALKFRTGMWSVMAQKHAKRDGRRIDRENDTQILWNFYMEMGARDDMEKEKGYATLRALLNALEVLVEKLPNDTLGRQILDEGVLQDGIVAVKKLSNSHTIDDEAFYRETTFLMSVKHKNIVRFLGFCAHTEHKVMKWEGPQKYIYPESRERLLCFEYMRNGSLAKHVTDELRGLEWHTRFQIIREVCEGLCYLHKEKNIIHRDLKPDNILLDDYMVPKIADFGISKFLEGVTHATTSNRTVSLGYCPHEYLRFGEVSLKTDVYSLGVIIIELVTGFREDPSIKNVLRRWRYRWNKLGNYTPVAEEQIQKCIDLAVRCMEQNPKRRPYIWNILDDLREVEPTIGHINLRNANEPTASQISPYPLEMIGIEPLEPHFPFEPQKQRTCSLELTNERVDNIAFRIDTIGPRRYHIEPNKGVVPPRSKSSVRITVQAHEKAPQGTLCRDEFVVWSTSVEDGLTAEDIIGGMFNEEGGKEVDEVYLSVVFDPPPFT